MTPEEAINHGKEQLEIFGGEHGEFIKLAIKALEHQPCEDCISRTEALKAIEKEKQGWEGSERYAIDECHSRIAELPSVTPQQKVGKWIKIEPYPLQMNEYKCSECGHETNDNTESYCSECGARMGVDK